VRKEHLEEKNCQEGLRQKTIRMVRQEIQPKILGKYHKRSLTCFVMNLDIVSKELRSRVRQATKDVVKSEV